MDFHRPLTKLLSLHSRSCPRWPSTFLCPFEKRRHRSERRKRGIRYRSFSNWCLIIIFKAIDSSVILLGWVVLVGNLLSCSCEFRLKLSFFVFSHVLFEQTTRVGDLPLLVDVVVSDFVPQNALVIFNHLANNFQMEHICIDFGTEVGGQL